MFHLVIPMSHLVISPSKKLGRHVKCTWLSFQIQFRRSFYKKKFQNIPIFLFAWTLSSFFYLFLIPYQIYFFSTKFACFSSSQFQNKNFPFLSTILSFFAISFSLSELPLCPCVPFSDLLDHICLNSICQLRITRHTWYFSRTPRIYLCKIFLAGVNFFQI